MWLVAGFNAAVVFVIVHIHVYITVIRESRSYIYITVRHAELVEFLVAACRFQFCPLSISTAVAHQRLLDLLWCRKEWAVLCVCVYICTKR